MSTKLKAGTSTSGAVIDADTTGILELQSGSTPTTAITVNASQNVGIGTSSPAYKLDVSGSTNAVFRVSDGTYSGIFTPSSLGGIVVGSTTNHPLLFLTNNTEVSRIDTSGNLCIGRTSAIFTSRNLNLSSTSGPGAAGFALVNTNASTKPFQIGPDGNGNFLVFNDASAGVYVPYGGVAWVANSDERLKTELTPFKNAVEKVTSIRSGTGRYLNDDESVSRSFLIAQDVQKVLPEAVTTQEDEIGTLGVAYTDVIPLLVAAIQELNAKVDAQAAEIQALKETK